MNSKARQRYSYFIKSLCQYQVQCKNKQFQLDLSDLWPILTDLEGTAGDIISHYFFQDIWAAKKIKKNNPNRHIDIGSRIDGFISHLLVFRSVELIDIRPLPIPIDGLTFIQDDATTLKSLSDNSIDSLSSLHAAEHFGLGRYGDDIDPNAYITFATNLQRVLKPKGHLYFSVPIGRERVQFNAHRIFSPETIINLFSDLSLLSFSAITDTEEFVESATPSDYKNANYSCGLFEFTK